MSGQTSRGQSVDEKRERLEEEQSNLGDIANVSTKPNKHNIISLSKLKNYMPKNIQQQTLLPSANEAYLQTKKPKNSEYKSELKPYKLTTLPRTTNQTSPSESRNQILDCVASSSSEQQQDPRASIQVQVDLFKGQESRQAPSVKQDLIASCFNQSHIFKTPGEANNRNRERSLLFSNQSIASNFDKSLTRSIAPPSSSAAVAAASSSPPPTPSVSCASATSSSSSSSVCRSAIARPSHCSLVSSSPNNQEKRSFARPNNNNNNHKQTTIQIRTGNNQQQLKSCNSGKGVESESSPKPNSIVHHQQDTNCHQQGKHIHDSSTQSKLNNSQEITNDCGFSVTLTRRGDKVEQDKLSGLSEYSDSTSSSRSSKILKGGEKRERCEGQKVDLVSIDLKDRTVSSGGGSSSKSRDRVKRQNVAREHESASLINMVPSSMQYHNNAHINQLSRSDSETQTRRHCHSNIEQSNDLYSNSLYNSKFENDLNIEIDNSIRTTSQSLTCFESNETSNKLKLDNGKIDQNQQDKRTLVQGSTASDNSSSSKLSPLNPGSTPSNQNHILTSLNQFRALDSVIISGNCPSNTSSLTSKSHKINSSHIKNNSNNNSNISSNNSNDNNNNNNNDNDDTLNPITRVDYSNGGNTITTSPGRQLTQVFNNSSLNHSPHPLQLAKDLQCQDRILQQNYRDQQNEVLSNNHSHYAENQANDRQTISNRMSNCATSSYPSSLLNQQMRSGEHQSSANIYNDYTNSANSLLDDHHGAIPVSVADSTNGLACHYHHQHQQEQHQANNAVASDEPITFASAQQSHLVQNGATPIDVERTLQQRYCVANAPNSMPTHSSKSSSPNSSLGTPPPSSNSANNKLAVVQQQHSRSSINSQQIIRTNNNSTSNSSTNSMSSVAMGFQQQLDHLNQHYSNYSINNETSANNDTSSNNFNSGAHGQAYGPSYYHHQMIRPTSRLNEVSSISQVEFDIHHHQHQLHNHHHHHQQQNQQQPQQSHYQQNHLQTVQNQHLPQHHQQSNQHAHHQVHDQNNINNSQLQDTNQQNQPCYNQQHNQHSLYHQLANNQIYGSNPGPVSHHHIPTANDDTFTSHPSSHHISSAAAQAVAVVSQTLKTVANQHHSHPYGTNHHHHHPHHHSSIRSGFGSSSSGIMGNIAHNTHHQTFQSMSHQLNHHLTNQAAAAAAAASAVAHHQDHYHSSQANQHHVQSLPSRKYQCKMCPQVFMSKAEMKYHNQNHLREAKPYKCSQCPKAFANSSYLSQHMRIHQGVKPYSCDTCSRKFTQLSHLQQHKRTHTGDKPYKCTYSNCTKQFSQLSNLQSHSRSHQLDKPYKCNSCYKCFHDEISLLEHIPRHLESKHLKKNLCVFCGSSYQHERGLVKHFQQYHTDKTPTLVAAAIAAGTTGDMRLIASLVSTKSSHPNYVSNQANTLGCGSSTGLGGSRNNAVSVTKGLNSSNVGPHAGITSTNGYS